MPASGLPSRTRMALAAGDNTREGRVMRRMGSMSRQRMVLVGDPFLGIIGKALGGLVKTGISSFFGTRPAPSAPAPIPFPGGITKPNTLPETIGKVLPPFFPKTSIPGGVNVPASGFRRRRRMNPLNPRALRRALSRAGAFSRFARRALHVTFGKTPKIRFRLRRKRAR